MNEKIIRVLLIDDDVRIILPGMKALFRSDRDGIEFIPALFAPEETEGLSSDGFDVILLDLFIGRRDPILNIRMLRKRFPGKPIVIYSTEESSIWRKKVALEGVSGFLTKKNSKSDIRDMIRKCCSGEEIYTEVNHDADDRFIISYLGESVLMTPLQKVIIQQISEGETLNAISKKMKISRSCVDKNLCEMRANFEAKNTCQLIKKLTESGLI